MQNKMLSIDQCSKVAILTSTCYPGFDDPRNPAQYRPVLALKMFAAAQKRFSTVIAVDSGSSSLFLEEARKFGVRIMPQVGQGKSSADRESYQAASGIKGIEVFATVTAEKVDYIESCCVDACALPLLQKECDVSVPCRDDKSFSTYPQVQQASEQIGNHLITEMLINAGYWRDNYPPLDYFFGPLAFNRAAYKWFMTPALVRSSYRGPDKKWLRPDLYSGLVDGITLSLHFNLAVQDVPVSFAYPRVQERMESKDLILPQKRVDQLGYLTTGTRHLIRELKGLSSGLVLSD